MKIPRHHIGQPERQEELEAQLEKMMTDMVIEASDAGYELDEISAAMKNVRDFTRNFRRRDLTE
ncbi:hypothetical protein IHQ71_18720 [Rhizobium sp. TH2]|uniref:hypothetical protein n=1 Tax=Rhizobium sp. TH2 TaxID=2775403 RepID=UPI0021574E01|nr:hypothetical protein [Rhizobium sp. TH2]UVC07240.1 hypothetical protein IHQ71_18720 [Rhizobium sp. TH2]